MNQQTIWRSMGGNNQRTGAFAGEISLQSNQPQALNLPADVIASPVCSAQGQIFIADMSGNVQALAAEQPPLWQTSLEGGIYATPALSADDTRLFVGTLKGIVYALDTANGEVVWRRKLYSRRDPRILSDLLLLPEHGRVVTSSWGEQFVALNTDDGKEAAAWSAGPNPYAPAAADAEGTIYCLRSDVRWEGDQPSGIRLVRIDPETGAEESLFFEEQSEEKPVQQIKLSAAPVLDLERKRIYCITNYNLESHLQALSLETGAVLFSRTFARHIYATPTLLPNGNVVLCDLTGCVRAISPEGDSVFDYETGAYYLLSRAIGDARNTVWVGDIEGKVHQISPAGEGKVLFEAERSIQGSPAVTPQGTLLFPCMDGNLYRLA